jgi:DNA-binding NarL/FixJ family response regulator
VIAGELLQTYKEGNHIQQEGPDTLTPRQREVLQLLAEGHSAKEIADILCISPSTVEFHKIFSCRYTQPVFACMITIIFFGQNA